MICNLNSEVNHNSKIYTFFLYFCPKTWICTLNVAFLDFFLINNFLLEILIFVFTTMQYTSDGNFLNFRLKILKKMEILEIFRFLDLFFQIFCDFWGFGSFLWFLSYIVHFFSKKLLNFVLKLIFFHIWRFLGNYF